MAGELLMNERTVTRIAGWVLVFAVAYIAWHLWLMANHETPQEFLDSIAAAVRS